MGGKIKKYDKLVMQMTKAVKRAEAACHHIEIFFRVWSTLLTVLF